VRNAVTRNAGIGLTLFLVSVLAGCGGQPVEVVQDNSEPSGMGSVFKDMRRDETLGEGGWFKFTLGTIEYPTEWGYADVHENVGANGFRIILLNNPVGSGSFPALRIVIFTDTAEIASLQGTTLADQNIMLKMEKKKGRGLEGKVAITFSQVGEGWIEGSFTGNIDVEGQSQPIQGSFKAHLNLPDEQR
jgi:hypothetical protein